MRCCNPNNNSYRDYGGRKTKDDRAWISDTWRCGAYVTHTTTHVLSYLHIAIDIEMHLGRKPHPTWTLDRINNNIGYWLEGANTDNIRWASDETQNRNKRKAQHHPEYDDKLLTALLPKRNDRTKFRNTAIQWYEYITGLQNPSPQLHTVINMIANAIRARQDT